MEKHVMFVEKESPEIVRIKKSEIIIVIQINIDVQHIVFVS